MYNGERFLRDALESILGQSFTDFTLVVSDNASTDGTVEIVEEYASRDHRVVLLQNVTNRGAAWNYNNVFEQCESPYFKWAAADDLLAPTCLERLLHVLQVVAAHSRSRLPALADHRRQGRPVRTYDDKLAAPPGSPPHLRLRQVLRNLYLGNVVFALVRPMCVPPDPAARELPLCRLRAPHRTRTDRRVPLRPRAAVPEAPPRYDLRERESNACRAHCLVRHCAEARAPLFVEPLSPVSRRHSPR